MHVLKKLKNDEVRTKVRSQADHHFTSSIVDFNQYSNSSVSRRKFVFKEMDDRANTLRSMQICRFCLDEKGPFTNIYEKDSRDGKQSIPLPLQIMACVAIEVFANDGMPQLICNPCRSQTIGAYNFKTTCKKSDDCLKLYLATGNLSKPTTQSRRTTRSMSSDTVKVDSKLATKKSPQKSPPESELQEDTNSNLEHQFETDGVLMGENQEMDGLESQSEHTEEEFEEDSTSQQEQIPLVTTDVFPCTECERSFPLKQLLDLHMKNHNRERSFACECGRKFFTKYDLAKHLQTHTAGKPYTCVICNKQFARESLLHRHEKIHVDVPKYLCSHCDRTFLTRRDLDAHSEKHKKKRPFHCRICKKGFVFKQGLERHELTHTDEKPHKCNYCEASFTSPIKLMRHITSHAGLRPYPCKLCGRTFLLSHHLTRHMRSHYANKSPIVEPVGQHKCDVCSMSFRRKDSLINHSAIHSMVNLKCVICNTAFQNAKQVKEHITTHLAGLPYPCDKCDYSFETQDQLEEHELKHAEMEYEEQIEQEVTQEAQQQEQMQFEDEYEDDDDDDIAEFTITNDGGDNPEVVRRPRASKIKNYAQFLKDELGSEVEDEILPEEKVAAPPQEIIEPKEYIKPIVRTEGTKVYTRKSLPEKKIIPEIKLDQIDENPSINLDNLALSQQVVKDLPNKQFVDMRIGDKTVRVQKLMMTKSEIEAMAKQGKIEMKGDTIILKKQGRIAPKEPTKNVTIENIIDEPKPSLQKPLVTKTYVKKTPANNEGGKQGETQVTN